MYLIKQTETFIKWLKKLKDIKSKVSILRRVERMKSGNFRDYKSLGDEISEFRIPTGPRYRVYYTKRGDEIIVLLVGGDKSTQSDDIAKAKHLVRELENG